MLLETIYEFRNRLCFYGVVKRVRERVGGLALLLLFLFLFRLGVRVGNIVDGVVGRAFLALRLLVIVKLDSVEHVPLF
jgi:hypothetical protein